MFDIQHPPVNYNILQQEYLGILGSLITQKTICFYRNYLDSLIYYDVIFAIIPKIKEFTDESTKRKDAIVNFY